MGHAVYQTWLTTVQNRKDSMAVRNADGSAVSFASLQAAVEANLDRLSELKACQNRILAIQFENSSQWLEAFLAAQAVGAILLPFDPDVPREGLREAMDRLRPAAFWNTDGLQLLPGSRRRKPACLVKLTSGSTGLPKPLVFEDRQMLADGKQVCLTMGIRPEDRNLAVVPFGHSYGLGNLVMPLIQFGTSIAVCSDPFPHSLASCIEASRSTVVPAVPALLTGLARAGVNASSLSSVRLWISAGSPLQSTEAKLFQERIGAPIHNFYGSSETGGIAYDRTGQETLTGRSVGRPMAGVQASTTASGRLCIRSEAVYLRGNPRRSGQLGGHLMADLAEILEDGSIALLGRRTRMVKITGKRVNLSEIERRLVLIKEVESAYVREFKDSSGRTRLFAVISPEIPVDPVREELRQFLPGWKIPLKWLCLDRLPLNARGKLDTRRLQELIGQSLDRSEK